MSKKLAEVERLNLYDRCTVVIVTIQHLQNTVLEMENASMCFPEPWRSGRSDSAGEIGVAARAVAKSVEDLLFVARNSPNMDLHEKTPKVGASELWD